MRIVAPGGDGEACLDARKVDAFIANVPYGRVVGVERDADAQGRLALDALAPLLSWLRPQATAHAYFSGVPLAPLLERLGYAHVHEVCVDDTGRRYLCVAVGSAQDAHAAVWL